MLFKGSNIAPDNAGEGHSHSYELARWGRASNQCRRHARASLKDANSRVAAAKYQTEILSEIKLELGWVNRKTFIQQNGYRFCAQIALFCYEMRVPIQTLSVLHSCLLGHLARGWIAILELQTGDWDSFQIRLRT